MINKETADMFVRNLNGLGYVKINTGKWDERIVDDGQGFPTTTYVCPFCSQESHDATNYCPNCGAKMNGES